MWYLFLLKFVDSGHYYSYVKASDGNWYCMNDSSVSRTSFSKVNAEKAYLLFYTCNDSGIDDSQVEIKAASFTKKQERSGEKIDSKTTVIKSGNKIDSKQVQHDVNRVNDSNTSEKLAEKGDSKKQIGSYKHDINRVNNDSNNLVIFDEKIISKKHDINGGNLNKDTLIMNLDSKKQINIDINVDINDSIFAEKLDCNTTKINASSSWNVQNVLHDKHLSFIVEKYKKSLKFYKKIKPNPGINENRKVPLSKTRLEEPKSEVDDVSPTPSKSELIDKRISPKVTKSQHDSGITTNSDQIIGNFRGSSTKFQLDNVTPILYNPEEIIMKKAPVLAWEHLGTTQEVFDRKNLLSDLDKAEKRKRPSRDDM
jgi:hypothetical protein